MICVVLQRVAVTLLLAVLAAAGTASAQEPRSIAELFSRGHTQALLMRIEVGLARVQARRGIIPNEAAEEIARTATIEAVPPATVAEEQRRVGHPLVALLNAWARVTRNGAVEWIHYGATTQDIYDTAQVIQTREAMRRMIAAMERAENAMLRLAEEHRATLMIGRTVGRHALPITFGLKVASWMAENRRNIDRMNGWLARTNTGMLSGAVGSYAALGPDALALEAELMQEIGLGEPWPVDWKGAKDMFAEYGALLGIAARSWARVAQEIFLMQGDDLREVGDPGSEVGSSTMPHKVNPGRSRTVVALARVVPHQAEVLQEWQVSIRERDQISNADTLGEVSTTMDRLLTAAAGMMEGLQVYPENMCRNLGRTNGLIMAEHAMFLLGERIGEHTAHEEVRLAARAAWERGTSLVEKIAARPGLASLVVELDLANQLNATRYIGLAPAAVDRTIAAVRTARGAARH
ncbi:lyase family protein [Roseomonas harenae]|uniref:lyase family protein n=1 Tax=Muricoccus harenae TaxID=2692566 RepID=UPI001331AC32|nr:lyase family protein [Roseomonas harenae]